MVGKVVTLTLALAGAHVASPASRNGCPPAGPFTCSTVRQLPQLTGSSRHYDLVAMEWRHDRWSERQLQGLR